MNTSENIKDSVSKAFNSLDTLESVKVSPFFKDKTMQRLFVEKEVPQPKFWAWLTPQVQFAMLVCFLVLNVFAFTRLNNNTYNDNMSEFAETYGLSVNESSSLLN